MSSPSKRKFDRQKERQKKLAQKNAIAVQKAVVDRRRRRYAETFPEFVFVPGNAPAGFIDLIRQAVATLDFENREQFGPREREFFATLKSYPYVAERVLAALNEENFTAHVHLMTILGHLAFEAERERINQWIPYNDVRFWLDFTEGQILVKFDSMLQEKSKTQNGTIYYSKHRPMVDVEGNMKIIGWRSHAVNRVCERLAYDWRSYGGLGDAFAFLSRCTHFERSLLYPNQLAFTFFNKCFDGFSSARMAEVVLGDESKNGEWFYRLGYCAADLDGDFLVARTVLFPGYGSTPEYGLMAKSSLPKERKETMRKELEGMTFEKQVSHESLGFMKWFHDNGIPQVVRGSQNWFNYS